MKLASPGRALPGPSHSAQAEIQDKQIFVINGKNISFLLLLSILPIVAVALAWSAGGILAGSVQSGSLAATLFAALVFSHIRIQLPKTRLFLSISDVFIAFALLSFGGELAIAVTVVVETYTTIKSAVVGQSSGFRASLANFSISVATLFITVLAISALTGSSNISGDLRNGTLLMIVVVMTIVPCVINSFLAAVFMAAERKVRFWETLRTHILDAALVYLSTALMAGLFVLALHETNVFLFVTVAGVLGLLHAVFRRYGDEQRASIEKAERAERERAELAEKHVGELQVYIAKVEQSSIELKRSREKFKFAAFHDQLTGLPNRNHFIDAIHQQIFRSRSDPVYRFAFVVIDLQNFKVVNESLGRQVGDGLIIEVAQRLRSLVKLKRAVGRIGGDEFCILLQGIEGDNSVLAYASVLLDQLAEPFELDGRQFFIRAKLGIAIGDGDTQHAEDVIRDAEMAMNKAKERNRGCVMFDSRMLANAVSTLQIETDLRRAVANNEFEIHYQPIVDLTSTRIHGFEALVRWKHSTLGMLPPTRFIPIAEATGMIIPMTQQILETACRQLVKWNRREGERPLFASVNLSGTHFGHPGLVDHIETALENTGLDPRYLKLEITETVVMENAEAAISMLRQIKDLGVQISIDDFGTGYSSLSYLQRFPIDTLKIDRAFVRSMEDGRQNGEIVRAVLALAEAMKLSVVAEGIDSIHQLHQLMILSCEYGQGYLFSPPLEARDFELLLDDQSRWQTLTAGNDFTILSPLVEAADTCINTNIH